MKWQPPISSLESVPPLARDCVHVWTISTAGNGNLDRLAEVLSGEERARAERFHFDRDRRCFIACRGTLRRLISFYTGQDPAAIRFLIGLQGKPSLVDARSCDLRFNVSHSGGLALLAFSLEREIGVDVEFKRADVDFAALAEMSFSKEERAALLACPLTDRANLFYEYWTCKEACIKADGRGLSVPLDQFRVTAAAGNSQWREIFSEVSSLLPSGMMCRILDAGSDYAAAVATNAPSWKVVQLDMDSAKEKDAGQMNHECRSANPSDDSRPFPAALGTYMFADSPLPRPAPVSERGER
jgi:4'-phosphopantetheinyl transferase